MTRNRTAAAKRVANQAEVEAFRMLRVGFADVVPSDAEAFALKSFADLDHLQRAAVDAIAALVSRYDKVRPHD